VGPAMQVDLDDPKFAGRFNGQTHMSMLGSTGLKLFDYLQEWSDKNIPNPRVPRSCK
jgi:hypothetical protein